MPYLPRSWRGAFGLRWLARIMCVFGSHYWFRSSRTDQPIACATCGRRTSYYHPNDY